MSETLTYYNQNAVSFVEETKDVDFKAIQDKYDSARRQGDDM